MEISQQLLLAVKMKDPATSFIDILKNISPVELKKQLVTENDKKAFWINIYNAVIQTTLAKDPEKYNNRALFFGSKLIIIAGKPLSLDDIEHGILRHSKLKWSGGYLNKLFPSSFEKMNRVKQVDYRIHFSLNCGATSCPPIAFYKPEQLDQQLELATEIYLKGECDYNEKSNEVWVPALMNWFRGDFKGTRGIKTLLRNLSIIPPDTNPVVRFKRYNWNLFLDNYKNE